MISRDRLYRTLLVLIPVFYFLSLPISVGDLAVWIAHGRLAIERQSLVTHDVFSVLPTSDLVYPAGASLLYGGIYNLFGNSSVARGLIAVSLFHKLVLMVFLWSLYSSSLFRLKNPWNFKNTFLVFALWNGAAALCIDRPALLAIIPFIFSYRILAKREQLNTRDLAILVFWNVVWVNLHGSFVLLPTLFAWRVCARWIARIGSRYSLRELIGGPLVLASSLLNPFGYKIFPYVLETVRASKTRAIDEWIPTLKIAADFHHRYFPQSIWFLCLIVAFVVFLALQRKGRQKLKEVLCSPFTFLLILGFESIRNTVWPFLALLPFSYTHGLLRDCAREPAPQVNIEHPRLNAALVSLLILACFVVSPFGKPISAPFLPNSKRPVFDQYAPFGIARKLDSLSAGKIQQGAVFNDWNYGSFLMLAQSRKIFIDTRNIIYSDRDFSDYLAVIQAAPGWEEILSKYNVAFVLLEREPDRHLLAAISHSANWELAETDGQSFLFSKKANSENHKDR